MPVRITDQGDFFFADSLAWIQDQAVEQAIVGGGRRRRGSQSVMPPSGDRPPQKFAIANFFYQVNISFFFVLGGDNHSIYNLQSNAADNEVVMKVVSI